MQDLKDSILSTVRSGGNVLLPTDAAGRVLELVLFLDRLWNTEPGLAQVYFKYIGVEWDIPAWRKKAHFFVCAGSFLRIWRR
jgi:predicted metal-dependent RNase